MVQVTVPSPPYNQTVLLAKNSTTEVVFPTNYMLTAGERSRKLVTVSSDADISVIAFNTGTYSADAFACLSKQDLGTEYFIFTSPGWYGNHFAVGNGEDVETQVNITVSGSLLIDGTRYQDKQMVSITLAPQEVLLLSDANDLTGTRVASSTPVAVFSGSKCYSSPSSFCDTVIEQLYPVQRWGQQFVVFPLMTKEVRDTIIIIAARPNTTITLRTESTTLQYSLQPGSHVTVDLQTGMLVNATKPIMVGYLFQGGYSSLPFIFDPFIANVPPSNFSWRYYKFVTKESFNNSLFIVSRSSSSLSDFLLDYRPLSDYVSTVRHMEGFTGWEVNLGKISGQHEISHQSETFGIYVYGVENSISYGYSLGQAESFSGYSITTGTENSRTATSKGRSFIVAFTENLITPATLALQLSSYDEPCMVQVTVPFPLYNETVLLTKNSTTEVVFPTSYMLTAGERSRKLVTVSSDADISVIAFNTASATADAFACLSEQELGTEYFVFTSVSGLGNHFAVGNGQDVETQVNITVSGSLLVDGTRYEDKQMVTINLAPQEVILLSDANDLTGTRVVSSAPVAVFSGSKCYNSPPSFCDTLIEQLYPVKSWGQQFVVFPLMTKEVRDRIIIIPARPNTTVTLRTENTTLQYSLQPGSHVTVDLQTGMLVYATKPIMVGYLFQGGYSSLPFIFDPFIATVPPSNFSRRYYKFVTKAFFNNSLFIVSRSSSSSSDFLLDYRPLSDNVQTVWHLEGFTGWEVNLGKIGGQHEISHQSETFGIYVYGVERAISYGYSLGQTESFSGIEQLLFYICHFLKISDEV
ncbi:uncharacterized protein LOC144827855 [Lissotriton helveticus]